MPSISLVLRDKRLSFYIGLKEASLVAQMVKKSACNAGDLDSIPGSGRCPGEGNGYHSSILAWRIPWTVVPGGLQSTRSQRVRHD